MTIITPILACFELGGIEPEVNVLHCLLGKGDLLNLFYGAARRSSNIAVLNQMRPVLTITQNRYLLAAVPSRGKELIKSG